MGLVDALKPTNPSSLIFLNDQLSIEMICKGMIWLNVLPQLLGFVICYTALVPIAPLGVPQGERAIFSTKRGVIEQWWSWMGPLVHPLGVLWFNGTADCPLTGF